MDQDRTGAFRIEGAPAGRHRVAVWHPELGPRTVEIEVPAGGVALVAFPELVER